MIFETSGSTGERKRIHHVSALLRREAAFFLQLLGAPKRVVRFVPAHHLYGYIFGVLLPELARVPVFDARTYYGGYRPVNFQPGDLGVAAPHQWRWLQMHTHSFPCAGVTSTAPCPADLFGVTRLLDVYGSTETSGVGYRFSAEQPYQLLPWWNANDHALRENDILEWTGPREFRVLGRRDSAVQVSGVNIYPSAIERRLLKHAGIAYCAVRLMRPEQGRRLKAFIVLKPEEDPDRIGLEEWIHKSFEGPEEIASVTYGPVLPTTSEGKACDW